METVTVTLVGGPPDWAGKTLTYPRSVVYDRPIEEAGAYLISAHPPERGPDAAIATGTRAYRVTGLRGYGTTQRRGYGDTGRRAAYRPWS